MSKISINLTDIAFLKNLLENTKVEKQNFLLTLSKNNDVDEYIFDDFKITIKKYDELVKVFDECLKMGRSLSAYIKEKEESK